MIYDRPPFHIEVHVTYISNCDNPLNIITPIYLGTHLHNDYGDLLDCPGDVTACLTMGTNSFIDLIDESTVLKYPHIPGDEALALLNLEAQILQAIEPYKHIIDFKKLIRDSLLFECAPFGSISEYFKNNNPDLQQRLEWICQITEALATVYKKHIIAMLFSSLVMNAKHWLRRLCFSPLTSPPHPQIYSAANLNGGGLGLSNIIDLYCFCFFSSFTLTTFPYSRLL